ncbi:expressed unknown protein [Seminavis robusta]|uniref:Uncharacterized protein n=1 Tax=Seminavis robusta TaxID=568900 RepID=A0A9N8ES32_9STRA|nr:expressed unknown protein [Seminavis robusta]|eukprot:Sro1443_g273141.1  (212) ;mRNA; f:8101-8736
MLEGKMASAITSNMTAWLIPLFLMLIRISLIASFSPIVRRPIVTVADVGGISRNEKGATTIFGGCRLSRLKPLSAHVHVSAACQLHRKKQSEQLYRYYSTTALQAKPKRGSVVDSYRTVSVNCAKCQARLFRYKKKNGTKSNLVKCYIERIAEDSAGVLENARAELQDDMMFPQDYAWQCPSCQSQFARTAQIHGLPALKMVGGKIKMTKK